MPKAKIKRLYLIPILSKGLDVLELLEQVHGPISLEDVYKKTNISKTSVYRILKTLVHRGYVAQTQNGQYRLVAIDGHALPFAPAKKGDAANTESWTVVGGALVVRPNGTFQVETNYDTKGADLNNSKYTFSGTCFTAGSVVRMVWDGGGQTDLRVRGDTVVVNNQGTAFSYRRS